MSAASARDDLRGSAESLEHVGRAVDALLHFRNDFEDEIAAARESDPTCAMAIAPDAYAHLLTTEPQHAEAAAERFPAAPASRSTG